jgi:competence protein ComEA
VAALARLPGVGSGLAQRIVEERERRGRFDSPEALRYVLGMGPKKLAAIRPFITVRD